MPEPVSMIAAAGALGFASLLPRAFSFTGISREARAVQCIASKTYRHGEESVALNGSAFAACQELCEIVREASIAGWDGNVAPPVPAAAHHQAMAFLKAIPSNLPSPEFSVEPDNGFISMEWHRSYRKVFSVSIGVSNKIAYAGLDGGDKWHGVARFDGFTIPDLVLDFIEKTMA